jgi:DnaJ-class molecular chaperone
MSEFKACPSCRGQKTIIGMGLIPEECRNCLGVGYVKREIAPESIEPVLANDAPEEVENVDAVILEEQTEVEITPPSLKRKVKANADKATKAARRAKKQ